MKQQPSSSFDQTFGISVFINRLYYWPLHSNTLLSVNQSPFYGSLFYQKSEEQKKFSCKTSINKEEGVCDGQLFKLLWATHRPAEDLSLTVFTEQTDNCLWVMFWQIAFFSTVFLQILKSFKIHLCRRLGDQCHFLAGAKNWFHARSKKVRKQVLSLML